jgi:hypothetical protein
MNKVRKLLEPVPTKMLLSWFTTAEAGSGFFSYYDHKNFSTVRIPKEDIANELKTRDDLPKPTKGDPYNIIRELFR